MRAAVATGSSIEVRDDVADPTPGDPAAVAPLITSTVGVEGVTGALDALRAGEEIKVLIEH
jgi:hypothetical protein